MSSSLDQFIDLRGITCPMAFVKARLFLDECASEEIAGILVDKTKSNDPLPRSIEALGHYLLSVTQVGTLEELQELYPHDASPFPETSLQLMLIKVQVKK
ncbi:sulfurtransferase TusA family protein [Kordiimonas sp. SCSIO 12610]|uniref:sulfurtransferase TusA family protein n=1 Tax=Kordiimonas sp. SCSIO 12610 TaxID=2829597 RepID=UPI00210BCDE0|nr:sulfurtransferase TusA family protein [Kordiimonas sp. SCSIO 12610]UTW55088.1 sulfurtransferase TusA family protein [Kordiimonas sp. SCSIO 12610]